MNNVLIFLLSHLLGPALHAVTRPIPVLVITALVLLVVVFVRRSVAASKESK